MESEVLLGSPRPEVSSPSLSAEMANLGNRPGRGPWFTPSVSVDWESDGLRGGGRGERTRPGEDGQTDGRDRTVALPGGLVSISGLSRNQQHDVVTLK